MNELTITGDEVLLPGVRALDFWRWSLGDLRPNPSRGILAQFLTAQAVGDTRLNDDGWGNFDLFSPGSTEIEVKLFGYLKSWPQVTPSKIDFSGPMGRTWSETALIWVYRGTSVRVAR